jgi:hypothetical protein
MTQQFWVIGAEFNSTACEAPLPGTSHLIGPFPSYSEAKETWREHAFATRAHATTRYTIVTNAARASAQ